MRLGQVHRAGPLTGNHFRQECLFLILRSANFNCFRRAICQARIHCKRGVGRGLHFARCEGPNTRHAHAAIFRIVGQTHHSAFDNLFVSFFEACRGRDGAVGITGTAFLITNDIERCEDFRGEFSALFEDSIQRIRIRFSETFKFCQTAHIEHFLHDKFHVANGCVIDRHI